MPLIIVQWHTIKFILQQYKIQKYIQLLEWKKNQYKQGMSESGIK